MTKKKPGAKIGRPPKVDRNEERLNLMAEIRAKHPGMSASTAAERASDVEAESRTKPTDPAHFRRLWRKERKAEEDKGIRAEEGDWLWSHRRDEEAFWTQLKKEGKTPTLVEGKLRWDDCPPSTDFSPKKSPSSMK